MIRASLTTVVISLVADSLLSTWPLVVLLVQGCPAGKYPSDSVCQVRLSACVAMCGPEGHGNLDRAPAGGRSVCALICGDWGRGGPGRREGGACVLIRIHMAAIAFMWGPLRPRAARADVFVRSYAAIQRLSMRQHRAAGTVSCLCTDMQRLRWRAGDLDMH